ncbi:MAG: fatty acid desaturase [Alphaproteobacteria bacterium]|nr:fatty acid desaturase [Alphaproteobacteria bacterium]
MSVTPKPLTAEELSGLSRKADAPGVLRLSVHLAVLGVTGTLILTASSSLLTAIALLAHGVVMTFLFAPLHESVHRSAFRSRWLNRLAGWLGGAVLILPPRYFGHFHIAHHRHTQDPDRDPELLTPKPRAWVGYLWILTGIEYWYRAISGLASRAIGKVPMDFVPARQRARVVLESRLFLGGYLLAVATSIVLRVDWLLWLWVVPALLGQPFLRAYLLAEHWGCPAIRDMWRNTRSTVSNPLVRFFAWNMPYHAEHHAHASVPFHALPALSRRMAAVRRVVSPGYVGFHARQVPDLIRRADGL